MLKQTLAILVLLFCNFQYPAEENKSKEYPVKISLCAQNKNTSSAFNGCTYYMYVEIPSDFPYTTGFDVTNKTPRIQVAHSLAGYTLCISSDTPVTNGWVNVEKDDSEYQGIRVIIGGVRDDDIRIILSKHFKPDFSSSVNPQKEK